MLVKSTEFNRKRTRQVTFNLNDIAAQAEDMLENARRESAQLLEQTRQQVKAELAQSRSSGYDQGFTEGRAAGSEQGHAEGYEKAYNEAKADFAQHSAEVIEQLKSAFSTFDAAKETLIWQADQDVVALAVAIARKVTAGTMAMEDKTAAAVAASALTLLNKKTSVVIYVHPEHLDYLQKLAGDPKSLFGAYSDIRFTADEAMARGGCRVCTEHIDIDAQLDRQIDRIAQVLLMGDVDMPLEAGDADECAAAGRDNKIDDETNDANKTETQQNDSEEQ